MEYAEETKDRRITQLRKGILELAVMSLLMHDRYYGYSLVRALTEQGSISLKEGTIYPMLARLERDGLVHAEWIESEQGPPRKYYQITDAGRQLFRDLSAEFDMLASLVRKKWEVPRPLKRLERLLVRKG